MTEIRKQQCKVAHDAFSKVYDASKGEQYHIITVQEINVALVGSGLPPFSDKQELEDAMVSEFTATAKDREVAEEVVRYWVSNAVLD